MDVIDASTGPVRTERPTPTSTSATSCRFDFIRNIQKERKPKQDIILKKQDDHSSTHSTWISRRAAVRRT